MTTSKLSVSDWWFESLLTPGCKETAFNPKTGPVNNMGSTAVLVILVALAAVSETVETTTVSGSETTSTKKTLDFITTGSIPVVDGGNETWEPACDDMKSFMEGDDQCKYHQHEMLWTFNEEMAIDIAFILSSSLSACGSGFIMSVVEQRNIIFARVHCLFVLLCTVALLPDYFGQIDVPFDAARSYFFFPDCFLSLLMRLPQVIGRS